MDELAILVMKIFDFFKKKPSEANTTMLQPETEDSLEPVFKKLVAEYTALANTKPYDRIALTEMPTYTALKNASAEEKKDWLFFVAEVVITVKKKYSKKNISYCNVAEVELEDYMRFKLADDLQRVLLKTDFPITADELAKLIDLYMDNIKPVYYYDDGLPRRPLISRAEQIYKGKPVPDILSHALQRLIMEQGESYYLLKEHKINNQKIELLISAPTDVQIDTHDPFGKELLDWLQSLSSTEKQPWIKLIEHCLAGGNKPTPAAKWLKDVEKLITDVGQENIVVKMQAWLALNIALLKQAHKEEHGSRSYLRDSNICLLKGLIWCCAFAGKSSLHRSLLDYANIAYKKKPGVGPLAVAGGSACMQVFSRLPVKEGVPLLLAVKNKTDNKAILKTLDKLISEAAEKNGISAESIEEIAAPDFGMEKPGELKTMLGEYTAWLKVQPNNVMELTFEKNDKFQSGVPSAVKQHFIVELKALKQTQKTIEEQIKAHAERLESTYLKPRQWNFSEWKGLYIDHPLLAIIGRKLIWHFDTNGTKQQGIYYNGIIIDATETPLTGLDENTTVQLWHPIGFEPAYVLNWRNYFRTQQVVQPFKQAFREVYIVTDAELRTFSYSNRFAAHIVRQHQFAALAKQRGWQYALMGNWDCDNTPVKLLPHWNIIVEFFINGDWQGTTSTAGIFTYIATDQVRFKKGGLVLNMDEIPAIVFTEIMRDVDLFVGVCSVGNDQNWTDNGNQQLNTYWHNYSFSELGENAKMRMETLQFLVPKMKIAGQCAFDGKFLHVQGKLKKYKIHMGSGNILMEPNDQYLCIVPGGRNKDSGKLFLPFEGDNMLSIIISKALLLAEDDQITDTTITRQLK